jgi:hypothetical protein
MSAITRIAPLAWLLGAGLSLLAGVGCAAAPSALAPRPWWGADPQLVARARTDRKHDAVILRRWERREAHLTSDYADIEIVRGQEAVLVLTERGRYDFRVNVDHHNRAKLALLKVRTLKKDGRVVEITQENIISSRLLERRDDPTLGTTRELVNVPGLEVGDVVETQWAITRRNDWGSEEFGIPLGGVLVYHRAWPMLEMRWEYSVPGDWQVRHRVRNSSDQVRVVQEGSRKAYVLEARDVPARPRGAYLPPAWSYAPRLDWRIDEYELRHLEKRPHTWHEETRGWRARLYEDKKLRDGFRSPLSFSAGEAPLVRLAKAYEYVRRVPFDEWTRSRIRPLKRVLERERANNMERAVLLHELVAQAGLTPRFMVVRTTNEGELDPEFPIWGIFNHLLVYLPPQPQKGIPRGMFLDPTCQWCELGQVPSWVAGTQGIRVGDGLISKLGRVTGAESPPVALHRQLKLKLTADGRLEGTWVGSFRGLAAQGLTTRLRALSEAKKKSEAQQVAEQLWKGARVQSHRVKYPADPRDAVEYRIEFEVDGAAHRVDRSLVLPLAFLRNRVYDGVLGQVARQLPVQVNVDIDHVDELDLSLPPGHRLVDPPSPFGIDCKLMAYRQSARQEGGRVVLERKLSLRRGMVPAADYPALRSCLSEASKVLKVALTAKTN